MKLYENSKCERQSPNRCGYCRETGHNRLDCPHVAKDWEHWQHFRVPPRRQGWYRSRQQPKYWGEWYSDCMNTIERQRKRQAKASTPVVRGARKCGFCGSTGHNRRNCLKMAAFVELCKKANHNYRKTFYDVFVKTHGIDVGAAVELTKSSSWNTTVDNGGHIGLITKINLDKINIFTAYDGDYDHNEIYGQNLQIQALVDGDTVGINLAAFCTSNSTMEDDVSLSELVKRCEYRWANFSLSKVIGKSEFPLPDKWVSSYDDAWEFLAKKRSYEKLKCDGVVQLVEKWANHS